MDRSSSILLVTIKICCDDKMRCLLYYYVNAIDCRRSIDLGMRL